MSDFASATDGPALVHRSPKNGACRFARIDNAVLQDARLSFRARGVLAYVLCKPRHWRHNAENLAAAGREGVDSIRAAFRELAAVGYARLRKGRGERGHLVHRWEFSETPSPNARKPETVTESGKAPLGPPNAVLPGGGQPGSGQPPPGEWPRFETTVHETTVSLAPAEADAMKAGKKPSKAKAPRPPNPLFDCLATLDGSEVSQITASGWSGAGKALAEIRQVCPDVTPDEIRRRAANYRAHFRDATISPHALGKWWARCDRPPAERTASAQPDAPLRMIP